VDQPQAGISCELLYQELCELAGLKAAGTGLTVTGPGRILKKRDLTLVRLAGAFYLVIACDSDGGIGPKPNDTVRCDAFVLGRFGARVPLMEVLASGARPLVLVDTLAVEMEPTGRRIIEGVKCEARLAGMDADEVVTGSTEDNVPTTSTGIGVTVIGIAQEQQLRPGCSATGDVVVCVGIPKSAPQDEVAVDDPEIADIPTVVALGHMPFVHDILPVGSHGIEFEAREMAKSAGLQFVLAPSLRVDVTKSAGPSTCVLVSLLPGHLDELRGSVAKPVSVIGHLDSPE
jgi:hypothetical protein